MRVIFAGGKNVGCGCLDYLIDEAESTEVIAVIVDHESETVQDKWYRSATEIASKKNIPVLAPKNINSSKNEKIISELSPDMLVVVYYDKILKPNIISIPNRGCINLHMALAEEYRGCFPTTWVLLNDEKHTGVTLHYIDESIDTGDIIDQSMFRIQNGDTGKTLYNKCTEAGIELFKKTWPKILDGTASRRPQKTTGKTRYYRREFPSIEVDFNKNGREIYNHIRAMLFDPFPRPYFYIGSKKYTIVEMKEKEG